jgi:hypothetical protein
MKSKTARWLVLPALASVVLGGASKGDTIQHGAPPDPGDAIPTGSQAICPGVPAGTPLIANLRTGRAMSDSSTANLRLLFSDQPLPCEPLASSAMNTLARETCVSAWSFSLSLLPEMQKPGVYVLANYPVGLEDSVVTMAPDRGCGGGACSGGGFGSAGGGGTGSTPGIVEIYSVTDQCITGRFQGLMTGQIEPPPPDFDGAFHAVRCTPGSPR